MGIALENHPRIFGIAADTDGIDGVGDIAGALWRPNSQMSAVKAGLHPRQYLENNDSHTFFERLGDHVVTGPTMTNVNDFRAILIAGQ
jgi:hydroxypyruvate reductase